MYQGILILLMEWYSLADLSPSRKGQAIGDLVQDLSPAAATLLCPAFVIALGDLA